MNIKSILVISFLAGAFCVQESNAQSTIEALNPNKCIRSSGYVWSEIKKECIRAFELQTQLISKDNIPYASILFSASSDSVEVFSGDGQFILTRKKKNYFIGNQNETAFFIEKLNTKWIMGKLESDEILYRER